MKKINAKTTYTKENFLEFQKYHFFHKSKARIIFTFFGVFFCILGFLGFLDEDNFFGIVELTLGIFLLIEFHTPIIPILQTRYILKSDAMIIGLENTFTFYEDHLEAINKRSSSNVPYEELYCYDENKDYFYIYLNKVSAFLIKKDEVDNLELLSQILKDKVKRK